MFLAEKDLVEAHLAEVKRLFRPWRGILGLRDGWQLKGDGHGWTFHQNVAGDLQYSLCHEPDGKVTITSQTEHPHKRLPSVNDKNKKYRLALIIQCYRLPMVTVGVPLLKRLNTI